MLQPVVQNDLSRGTESYQRVLQKREEVDLLTRPVDFSAPHVSDKIRLVHVIDSLSLAGTELGVIRQSNMLSKGSFAITIIYLNGHQESALSAVSPEVRLIKMDRRPGFDWRLIFQLAKIFRRQRFDIIHSHNWATMVYAILASKLARVPVLIHGDHGRDVEFRSFKFSRRLANKLLLPLCDRITTVSEDIAIDWRREQLLPSWRIVYMPNGVDLNRFCLRYDQRECRSILELPKTALIIGTVVGKLRPVKNIECLLSAFATLRRSCTNLHLIVVGYGLYLENLKALASSLDIVNDTTFFGMRTDIPQIMAALDIYASTSIYEGMSNTILEAMAMAKPVVATAVGGIPFIIKNGVTGLVVPTKWPEQLAHAITILMENADLRQHLALAARQHIEQHHDLQQTINSYARLYNTTLARPRQKN